MKVQLDLTIHNLSVGLVQQTLKCFKLISIEQMSEIRHISHILFLQSLLHLFILILDIESLVHHHYHIINVLDYQFAELMVGLPIRIEIDLVIGIQLINDIDN